MIYSVQRQQLCGADPYNSQRPVAAGLAFTQKGCVVCSDVTWIIRNNELGGQVAPNQQPLALASSSIENFAPTGAEGVPNAPLFVPYQV